MTVTIKHKVTVRVWEDAEMKNALFAPDDKLAEITISNMAHASSGLITVEDGSDMDIPLPDISAVSGVFLKCDQDVSVAINGGAQMLLVRPSEGTSDAPTYCHLFFEGTITSINVEKITTVPVADANVRWVCWGDAEAE